MNLVETRGYGEQLGLRYQDIETFNFRYNTAFKNLTSAASKQGIRALQDKRAWLAAFDYKWCRRRMLSALREEVLQAIRRPTHADLFSVETANNPTSYRHLLDRRVGRGVSGGWLFLGFALSVHTRWLCPSSAREGISLG